MHKRTFISLGITLAGAALAGLGPARAQDFPNRPVKLVVPFATGGASDTFARTVGKALQERLGQPVVIENRTGAGGTVAATAVAKAPADGYTLLVGDIGTHGIASSLYPRLAYDAVKDFIPINHSVVSPLVMVVNANMAAQDVASFIAQARAKPGKINYASSGSGGISHLAVEMFKSMGNIDLLHVPYKGGAPALNDLMGGQVQMMMLSASTSLPHIRAGKVRAIAVAGPRRASLLPDVPTLQESGVAGYVVEPWVGILAPAGTPPQVASLLQREFAAAINSPAVREQLSRQGFDVRGAGPDELAKVIREDLARWDRIVKQSGAQVE